MLILGDDCRVFLAVVRSLGRRGLKVHAITSDDPSPAMSSRYIGAVHRLPPYRGDGSEWVAALAALIAEHDYRLIVPCSDARLMMLEHHVDRLGRERLAIANPAALAAFTDKAETRRLAAANGVPIAAGKLVSEADEADALVRQFGLPLALKPRNPFQLGDTAFKRDVRIVRDEAELATALAAGSGGFVVESFFAGDGVGVSVLARHGAIVQAHQHRRLHQVTETGASSSRISEAVDPELLGMAAALARATCLHGVAMFEFRQSRAMDETILLEVNPRFWGSLPLALVAGVDFPAMLYDLLVEDRSPACVRYRPGTRLRDLTSEYHRLTEEAAIGARPAARLARLGRLAPAVFAMAPGLLWGRACDSFASDDRQPWLRERRELIETIAQAIARRLPARWCPFRKLRRQGQ